MEFSSIIISIAIIIPGFISYNISGLSIYKVKISTFYATLYSILYSFVIWFFILGLLKFPIQFNFINSFLLENINNIFNIYSNNKELLKNIDILFNLIIFFIVLYILSFIIGIIISILRLKLRKQYNFIYGFLFKRSQYENVVDQVFETLIYDNNNKTIIFKTISGDYFIGEVSLVSSNLQRNYIYFSKVQKYSQKRRKFLNVVDNMGYCINVNSIEYMHISPDKNFDVENLK